MKHAKTGYISILLFSICLALIDPAGCTSLPEKNTVFQGQVGIYGTEPFTWPGIHTDSGEIYRVPPEYREKIWDLQGQRLEFSGYFQKDNGKQNQEKETMGAKRVFVPVSWKVPE
ncbi:hypothetical protein K7I13_14125 [Brucepastera parasyntrophica]|uniref:hypothetical protein n=1 Tax=Brucepastera parasyntrophica TaxID=2880008 RepID=UPI00210ED078|nr:hypothetical protein [Brucepastera parasyntrophica]ULQ59583.1 hypothetical protein K7I13_14125 [Brucepastera parasyntrophica]